MSETIPQLVAHRGFMRHYPENSWSGLEAALKAGACWLEFDVQMCRDKRFVLLHDDNFLRTGGIGQSVFSLDSHAIDISVHEPERFQQNFAPTVLPVLDDVLKRLGDFPRARAMIEIKQESIDHWGLETVMHPLVSLLASHQDQCCLISFNEAALRWCRRHSKLGTGWVLKQFDATHRRMATALGPDFLICNYRKIPRQQPLWRGPWEWMVYDITDPSAALEWADRGAALIETADIGGMLADAVLGSRACLHGL